MNTPAHVVVNLLILGRKARTELNLPIILGGVIPDSPMVLFYCYQKVFRKITEEMIWTRAYYEAGWQVFFDLFNAIPLFFLGFLLSLRFKAPRFTALFASMGLHALGDAAFHHSDAHRHLLPFSDWRFHSPVSYWEPDHYGTLMAPLEALIVIIGCLLLGRRFKTLAGRSIPAIFLAVYAFYWGYVFWVWI